MKHDRPECGFAALAAVLTICALLALAVIPASRLVRLAGAASAADAAGAASRESAAACVQIAKLRLALGQPVSGTVTHESGGDAPHSCSIDQVGEIATGYEVRTSAEFVTASGTFRSALKALIRRGDFQVIAMSDIGVCNPRAPPGGC